MSLKIPAGQTAALIGSSGSGKSTVMALLERFYDPVAAVVDNGELEIVIDGSMHSTSSRSSKLGTSNGIVMVDGVDIRKLDVMYLRSEIGLVGQEPVLFDASVKENIAFGRQGATDEEIIEAAKIANAHGFITKLDGGYEYNVGVRGKKVSGGQKQRIAIARAVLKNPRLVLMASSS
jgi:ATP-binding cassette subfamily B (MDR/TAP) protein 1